METKICTIANFNCTFKVDNSIKPMLEYFETIIFPAFKDLSLKRIARKKRRDIAHYFFYDVNLIEISSGEYALIGKHVKRAFLDIQQDITPENGIVPINEIKPSAPYSTFILLLKNHRLIYFKDQDQGSPNINSFTTTVNEIVEDYVRKQRNNLLNELKRNKFIYNDIHYKKIKDFTDQVLNIKFPIPEINIVPIESTKLVEEKFNSLNKIKEFTLYIYKPNAEFIYDDYVNSVIEYAEKIGTDKIQQTSKNPDNIIAIKNTIINSAGKVDFHIKAIDQNNAALDLKPDNVSEKIPVKINEHSTDAAKSKEVYEKLSSHKEIIESNEENKQNYIEKIPIFKKIMALFF